MYSSFISSLVKWSEETSDRQKLQHTFVAVGIFFLIAAGLAGLVNYQLSQQILGLAFLAGIVFLVNLVVWALLQSLVLLPLDRKKTLSSAKPRPATSRKR